MTQARTLAAPLGRTLIALIFIVSGLGKLANYAGTQGYMEAMGVPGALLPAVIALELIGGLAIVVGWKARVAAFLLAGFSLISGIIFHWDLSDQTQTIMLLKNLALTGGFLFIVAFGAGAWSFDNRSRA
jgi:putative oxidoreductase